ncbi:YraN family protein [Lysinibacter sp. HNR]|uniref:YraN family protein n=1 Tax=Lysinibacter sp. HNR TaxID=3031408 RepID=UPI002435382E|nr:YraN family protein [Lysinibacter sp. HNR]WGD38420.1 YraN family protein [Lysinibacter sp. HNR]
MAYKDDLGRWGESVAAEFLQEKNYSILHQNWRNNMGEIDIIAVSGETTVFIEVKTRSSTRFGHPFEAITTEKLARLRRLGWAWCRLQETPPVKIRIDAVAVLGVPGRVPRVEHLRGVF